MLDWTWSGGNSKGEERCRLDLRSDFRHTEESALDWGIYILNVTLENFEYNNSFDYQTTQVSFLRSETPNSGDADQLRK